MQVTNPNLLSWWLGIITLALSYKASAVMLLANTPMAWIMFPLVEERDYSKVCLSCKLAALQAIVRNAALFVPKPLLLCQCLKSRSDWPYSPAWEFLCVHNALAWSFKLCWKWSSKYWNLKSEFMAHHEHNWMLHSYVLSRSLLIVVFHPIWPEFPKHYIYLKLCLYMVPFLFPLGT